MKVFFIFFVLFCIPYKVYSSIEEYFPENKPTSSKYGNTGLIEIPTARFMEEGTLKFGISSSFPNEFTFMSASPFKWFEATYRYSEVKDATYGPSSFSGNQSLKDKGFDIKFLILKESYLRPAIALGLRDIAGTGAFSSEYLVASKEFNNIDLSIGIGWGNLGQLATVTNPFTNIDKGFENRTSSIGQGGTLNYRDWFSGEKVSLFGGLEYKLKKQGMRLKLEYDTSQPDTPFMIKRLPQDVDSRINLGIFYNISNFADIGLAFERGNQFRLSFVFKGNFASTTRLKKYDPPQRISKRNLDHNSEEFMIFALNQLKNEEIFLQGGSSDEDEIDISVSQSKYRNQAMAVGRTARVISQSTSDRLEKITINIMNGDIETSSFSIPNLHLKKALESNLSISELIEKSNIESKSAQQKYLSHDFSPKVNFPEFFWSMSPSLRHHIGGPESFYLGQLWWRINSNIKFTRNLTLSTVFGLDIYNNFDQLNNPSNSSLPHVRSDIQEYLKEGSTNIARFKLDYIWSPRNDWFARLDIGLIEEMYGGVGGEILYRPFDSLFAIGFTGHLLKQREFKQRFGFRDYEVFTGHLNSYFKLPKDLLLQIHGGRYLAKDKGVTLDISRRFKSGFRLGVFATRTNVPKELFGEGSFDKGFYFNIPLDLFYTDYRNGNISFAMHPLTRDGGAMLNNHNSLYGIFGDTTKDSIYKDFPGLLK